MYTTTAFLSGASDTLITVSHAFYIQPTGTGQHLKLDPASCSFSTYDTIGKLRDRIPIRYVRLYWDQARYYGDRSYDLGVVKLARQPVHATRWPGIGDGTALNGSDLVLLAHHNDVPNNKIARVTRGQVFPMPWNGMGVFESDRISSYRRHFITNLDSNQRASGGMFIEEVSSGVFGVLVGALSPDGVKDGEFDSNSRVYNYGIYFDQEFIDLVREVANDGKESAT